MMVFDAILLGDSPAHHFHQFFTFVGPVQSRGNQNQNVFAGDAGLFQRGQKRRENRLVGHRSRDVADYHTRVAAASRQFEQRGRLDRIGQTATHGFDRVGQRLGPTIAELVDRVALGQRDW